jgi:hypothetical protein
MPARPPAVFVPALRSGTAPPRSHGRVDRAQAEACVIEAWLNSIFQERLTIRRDGAVTEITTAAAGLLPAEYR